MPCIRSASVSPQWKAYDVTSGAPTRGDDFDYGLVAALDFDSLFDQRSTERVPLDLDSAILELQTHGRALLQARAGAGKSRTLERLARRFSGEGGGSAILSLAVLEFAEHHSVEDVAAAVVTGAQLDVQALDSGVPTLLLADGLNETACDAALLLRALDRLAARYPSLSILITDRLTRRDLPSSRWALFGLTPTSREDIERALGHSPNPHEFAILSSPFGLDRAVQHGGPITISAALRSEIDMVVRDSGATLEELSECAYRAYEKRSIFLDAECLAAVDADAIGALQAAGTLISTSRGFKFEHQLKHDFLAAEYVRENLKLDEKTLANVTFGGRSVDPLVLLLEMMDASDVDGFVRGVYDWNQYFSAYLIAEDARGSGRVQNGTTFAVLAQMAEKRFDPFLATSEEAADAIRLVPGTLAETLLDAPTPEEVRARAVAAMKSVDAGFQPWIEVFDARTASIALEHLRDADGLYGWAATNSVRRFPTDPEVEAAALTMLKEASTNVLRWRAAHVLGACDVGKDLLFEIAVTSGTDEDLRRGCLRSFIEQASRAEPEIQAASLRAVSDSLSSFLSRPKLATQLQRGLLLREPPASWFISCVPVLEALLANAEDDETYARLQTLASAVRRGGIDPT